MSDDGYGLTRITHLNSGQALLAVSLKRERGCKLDSVGPIMSVGTMQIVLETRLLNANVDVVSSITLCVRLVVAEGVCARERE